MDEEAVGILIDCGLEKRFPQECRHWKREAAAVHNTTESRIRKDIDSMTAKLKKDLPTLRRSLFEAVLDEALRLYP